MLTQKKLDGLRPKASEYTIADRDGLYIRIRQTGAMAWIFRYRYLKKPVRITIGNYDRNNPEKGYSLVQARDEARRLLGMLERGSDPKQVLAEEETAKVREKEKEQKTFAKLVKEFDEKILSQRVRPESPRRMLAKDVLPYIGHKPAEDVTRKELLKLLDNVANRKHSRTYREGAPTSANRLLSLLKQLFRYACQRELVPFNPLADITKDVVGGREESRDRALNESELRILLTECQSWKTAEQNLLFLRFLLGSGQRVGTCSGATWEEFDLEEGIWHIPPSSKTRATKSNSNNVRRLPLSDYLLETLKKQRRYSAVSTYVWPPLRSTDLNKPFNYQSFNLLLINNKFAGLDHFTPHDLRRTMATRMADLEIAPHIPEKIMGHELGGVMQVYNRAEYFKEQLKALNIWGNYLKGLESTNVIQLSGRRQR